MNEKNTQSSVPIILALGFLVCTIIAAYVYQTNKSYQEVVPTSLEPVAVNDVEKEDELELQQDSELLDTSKKPADTENSQKQNAEQENHLIVPILENQRVDSTGLVVLGGRSEPSVTIHILLNDETIEIVETDAAGNFATIFDIGTSSKVRVISLMTVVNGEKVYSDQDIIIAGTQLADPKVIAEGESLASELEPDAKAFDKEAIIEDLAEVLEPKTATITAKPNITEEAFPKEAANEEVTEALGPETENPPDQLKVLEEAPEKEAPIEEVAKVLQPKSEPNPTKLKIMKEVSEKEVTTDEVAVVIEPKTEIEPSDIKITGVKNEPNLAVSETTVEGIETTNSPQDKEPVVVVTGKAGVKIVQYGTDEDANDVAVDTISYDESGDVALAGRGNPAGLVRIYLDNTPVSTVAMDATGQWSTALSEVDAGIYTLRIDELDQDGKVNSRLETPFKRESLDELAAYLSIVDEPARVNVVTVQPGNTLWAIARERYGRGMLYVRVFEKNRDKIRDPDLIYPGQIFTLPDN